MRDAVVCYNFYLIVVRMSVTVYIWRLIHKKGNTVILKFLGLAVTFMCAGSALALENFITRDGHRLLDGEQEFRFAGIHFPEMHRIENDAAGVCKYDPRGWGQHFQWPTEDEQENWVKAAVRTGHKAMRVYVLSVHRAGGGGQSQSDCGAVHMVEPGNNAASAKWFLPARENSITRPPAKSTLNLYCSFVKFFILRPYSPRAAPNNERKQSF